MNTPLHTSSIVAIVPAAGVGTRMQSDVPKQYLILGEQTIIEHAIERLLSHAAISQIVVVLHPDDTRFSALPIAKNLRVASVTGGKSRAESVLAGLQFAAKADWVLVHDAVRPCLDFDDLDTLITTVLGQQRGGILATPVTDTLKQATIGEYAISKTVSRANLWQALTPQMFPAVVLRNSLTRALSDNIEVTDEAFAVEYCGISPLLIKGKRNNVKVTYAEDLLIAQIYLMNNNKGT